MVLSGWGNAGMHTEIVRKAAEIWAYFASFQQKAPSDAVVVCCSYDLRVCDFACRFIRDGWSDILLLSGHSGNWTDLLWEDHEAEVFYRRALDNGIKPEKIRLETRATNTGENIRFAKAMLPDIQTVTLISKPNSLLRLHLTAKRVWPEVIHYVAAPEIHFPEGVSNQVGVIGAIHEMVGDIQRIQKYPELGYQVEHQLPDNILKAYQFLLDQGFTDHLIP